MTMIHGNILSALVLDQISDTWNSIMNLVYIFNGKIFRVPWIARAGSHEPAEDLDQCSSVALLTLNF